MSSTPETAETALSASAVVEPPRPPRLLDQLRVRLRTLHYSYRTEQAYCQWVRRFVVFSGRRHPAQLGAAEIELFLSHLAVDRRVSASTQNQAKAAILFLYRQVLRVDLPWLDEIVQAKQRQRLPVVLTTREVRMLLGNLRGTKALVCGLLYGSGLRVMEGLRLRVKDVEFERREILVRAGKGDKDRVTMLPENLIRPLASDLSQVRALHERDLAAGYGEVEMPCALDQKYPKAGYTWGWQYVFPAAARSVDPRTGAIRRHHLFPDTIQRAIRQAASDAGIEKPCSPHPASFIRHPPAAGRL